MQLDHAGWYAVMCAVSPAPCKHAYICIPVGDLVPASERQRSCYTQQQALSLTAADAATRHQLTLMDNKEMIS